MRKLILFSILLFSISNSDSQFIKNFGLKGGFVIFLQHTYSDYGNNTGDGFDIGMFVECPFYKRFTSVFEIHYSDKGIGKGSPGISSPMPLGYSDYVDVNNKYQYLTFQALAKYSFSKNYYGFYGILGVREDLLLKNYYTGYYDIHETFTNGYFEFGPTLGAGYIFPFHFLLELQYCPNITYMLKYNLNGNIINFRNNSFLFLCGFCFK